MYTLNVFKFVNPNDHKGELDYQKTFKNQNDVREHIKTIYKFVDKTNIFKKNYVIAELIQTLDNNEKLHVEDYIGRGMVDSINKIQIWSRDRYDMIKGDNCWRIKEIISA